MKPATFKWRGGVDTEVRAAHAHQNEDVFLSAGKGHTLDVCVVHVPQRAPEDMLCLTLLFRRMVCLPVMILRGELMAQRPSSRKAWKMDKCLYKIAKILFPSTSFDRGLFDLRSKASCPVQIMSYKTFLDYNNPHSNP